MSEQLGSIVPPHSVEAEASVLGAMLLDRDAIALVIQQLDGDCFYREDHQRIFDAIIHLYEEHHAVDMLLLQEELKSNGAQVDIDYLASLVEAVPSAAHVEHYAQIVRQKAYLRRLINTCNETLRESYDPTSDADLVLDRAEARVFDVTRRRSGGEPRLLGDVLKTVFDQIDSQERGRLTGLGTLYRDLDDLTSGLHKSELIVVAGRPSIGKTTFALNIARNIAIEQNIPVGIFSMEMAADQIARNVLCAHARVSLQKMRRGFLSKEEINKLILAADKLSQAPFYIDDVPSLSSLELRAKARRLKAQYDIQLLVVDYLQLMQARRGREPENRQQEISQISRDLKALARELEVPLIAVSQLSRAVESREGNKPRLSDLRESGSIEQDADLVVFLYREDYYNPERRKGEVSVADVIVAKQRNGPTDNIQLAFLADHLRFENLTKEKT